MLTAEQIVAIRDAAGQIADPIIEFLLQDIARRISEAGQLTSTAQYQIFRAQNLGISQREIRKKLKALLGKSDAEIKKLLTQAAEVGYNYDLKRLPFAGGVPFEANDAIQQIVNAAVDLALEDLTNLTQTIGMVGPAGNALPLQEAYRACTDFAFQQVFTGAADYNTAIRRATRNLAERGLRVIDYESGVHTSLEAAVRRNLMGGLGLMDEQISQRNHDDLGCDGWEISAHANSAPDHEPIQGKQYPDAVYERLNNSLRRRIGTLNCGHAAFPVILGVNSPQYTPEQLERFRTDNEKGVTVDGKHYTGYEATQTQRKLERAIRKQKRRVLVDEATGDKEKLLTDQVRLQRYRQEYVRFSKAAGLRTQQERAQVAGFGRKEAGRAESAVKKYNIQKIQLEEAKKRAYNQKQEEVRALIKSDALPKKLNIGNQNKHILGSNGYIPGRSYIYGSLEKAQALVNQYSGSGEPRFTRAGDWTHKEYVLSADIIGVVVDFEDLSESETRAFLIHYGKNGTHIVPTKEAKMVKLKELPGKKVKIIFKDGESMVGVVDYYTSALDNEPDPESITIAPLEIFASEIVSIKLL